MGIFSNWAGIATPLVRSECPSCGATWRHRKDCELNDVSIDVAELLDSEKARKQAKRLNIKD